MNNSLTYKYFIGILLLAFILIVSNTFSTPEVYYTFEYRFIISTLILVLIGYYFFLKYQKFVFFSPAHIIIIFLIFIFWITPCVCIDNNDTYCHGVNVMNGCIKATECATLGILSFMLGYYITNVGVAKKKIDNVYVLYKKVKNISYYSFAFFFLIMMYAFVRFKGFSLSYILSFATNFNGVDTSYEQDSSMLFVGMAAKMMLVPWLIIVTTSPKKWDKIIISYLLFSVYFINGARYMIYIAILSYIIIHFRIKNKSIDLKRIILLIGAMLLLSTFIQNVRNNVRTARAIENSSFGINDIKKTLYTNFNIYQPFYGVVHSVPNKHNYSYGNAIFSDPLEMWKPRFLFPDKTEPRNYAYTKAIRKSVGNDIIDHYAMAMPILGDFYVDFGIKGVIIFMFLLGVLYKKSIRLYYSNNYFKLLAYAIICSTSIQVINRGFLPQLITLHIFLLLPILVYNKYFKYSKQKRIFYSILTNHNIKLYGKQKV